MAPVVDEPAVVALLGWRPGIDRLEPCRQRGAAPAGVDDEVGGDRPVVLGDHAGDVRDAGSAVVVGAESVDRDPATDLHTRRPAGHGGDGTLEHRPPRGHRVEPLVAGTEPASELVGQTGEGVDAQPTASLQLGEHLRELGFDLAAPPRQHEVEHAELPDAAALPSVPGLLRIVNRFVGVALEHGDFVPILRQQHRQGRGRSCLHQAPESLPSHHLADTSRRPLVTT